MPKPKPPVKSHSGRARFKRKKLGLSGKSAPHPHELRVPGRGVEFDAVANALKEFAESTYWKGTGRGMAYQRAYDSILRRKMGKNVYARWEKKFSLSNVSNPNPGSTWLPGTSRDPMEGTRFSQYLQRRLRNNAHVRKKAARRRK